MKKKTPIQQDFLNTDILKGSEKTNCNFFTEEAAKQEAERLGLPNQETIAQAIMLGDTDFSSNGKMNKARYISRWGKIGEQLAILLTKNNSTWQFIDSAQPCIRNQSQNIQIIIMSGNNAIGKKDEVIAPYCPKGIMTLKNIRENQSSYDDKSKLQTWILYFPSTKHPCYTSNALDFIPFELAFPTSFEQTPKKSKIEIYPRDHSCRIAFKIDNRLPIQIDSKTEIKPSTEIKPDDFDIQLVVGS